MRFLYQVFIMLYTEDFSMRHYVGFSQIRSHMQTQKLQAIGGMVPCIFSDQQLTVLLYCEYYKSFHFTLEPWFAICTLVSPKIADATSLYFHKMLKNLMVTLMVTTQLILDIFIIDRPYWSQTLSSIINAYYVLLIVYVFIEVNQVF